MDFTKAFHIVTKASKDAGVPCVLIGGFAVNFYKVARNTLDIDFLITAEDLEKIKRSMYAAGYADGFVTDVAVRLTNKEESLDVDFMIVSDDTRKKILQEGQEAKVVGEDLIVPSVNHLIALKLHAIKNNRKNRIWKDLPDIIKLIKVNKIDHMAPSFKEMCVKYGGADIYEIILKGYKE